MMNENIGERFINGEIDSIVLDFDVDSDIFRSNEEFLREAERELTEIYNINGQIKPSDISRVMGLPQDYYQEEEMSEIKAEAIEQSKKRTHNYAPIETGYIPVEYNLYMELNEKAAKYDRIMNYLAKLGGESDADVQIRDLEKKSVLVAKTQNS